MTKWQYYDRYGETDSLMVDSLAWQKSEPIGATQLKIMQRARGARSGMVMLAEGDERERMAAKRLVARKLLKPCVHTRPEAGPGRRYQNYSKGSYRLYALTERGRHCWLRVKA